jgi:UDP-2-acetamido-3-amino-2,3-dideoxy-glucuronate N-acetyltransferase
MDQPRYYRHPNALVETDAIGDDTRVWAFAHVLRGAIVGRQCNVCDHVFIEDGAAVGDRVTIKCGVQIWKGVTLEDDVFVGPNATFTNDAFPRSRHWPEKYPTTLVRKGASIGANATILPGLVIGQHSMVGAGAVVTRNVPPYAVVVGNPARIVRYDKSLPSAEPPNAAGGQSFTLSVTGVRIVPTAIVRDMRGNLLAREVANGTLPFAPQRFFIVFDVPSREVRGAHAHRALEQLLVCIRGSVSIVVDDGTTRQEILLDKPDLGLYMPPMVWGIQYKYTPDAMLLVMASAAYDPGDYIRDYDQFLEEVTSRGKVGPPDRT